MADARRYPSLIRRFDGSVRPARVRSHRGRWSPGTGATTDAMDAVPLPADSHRNPHAGAVAAASARGAPAPRDRHDHRRAARIRAASNTTAVILHPFPGSGGHRPRSSVCLTPGDRIVAGAAQVVVTLTGHTEQLALNGH